MDTPDIDYANTKLIRHNEKVKELIQDLLWKMPEGLGAAQINHVTGFASRLLDLNIELHDDMSAILGLDV